MSVIVLLHTSLSPRKILDKEPRCHFYPNMNFTSRSNVWTLCCDNCTTSQDMRRQRQLHNSSLQNPTLFTMLPSTIKSNSKIPLFSTRLHSVVLSYSVPSTPKQRSGYYSSIMCTMVKLLNFTAEIAFLENSRKNPVILTNIVFDKHTKVQ